MTATHWRLVAPELPQLLHLWLCETPELCSAVLTGGHQEVWPGRQTGDSSTVSRQTSLLDQVARPQLEKHGEISSVRAQENSGGSLGSYQGTEQQGG